MNRFLPALTLSVLFAVAAAAQEEEPPPDLGPQQQYNFDFRVDALMRQEWTKEIFVAPDEFRDESRWRLQARPRLEAGFGPVVVGVGGDFNYSKDENNDPPPLLQRDNYDSRSARLDLAYGGLEFGPVRGQGGIVAMPVALTEMLWDRDLRILGGFGSIEWKDLSTALRGLGVSAVYSRGGHVFDDGKTTLLMFSGTMTFSSPTGSELELVASFLKFTEFASDEPLEPMLRRQNIRTPDGMVAGPFEVWDLVARFRRSGQAPIQLVADYSWNRELEADNKGLWLAAVLGSIQTTPARLEYTYAKVDRDATLGAYATDDFFWATGWEGHRVDIGVRSGGHTSLHAIGQLQRFKDSPRPEEREDWVKRYRLEWRFKL
jgi:hypothetical protein